jgi:competence protein ComEA
MSFPEGSVTKGAARTALSLSACLLVYASFGIVGEVPVAGCPRPSEVASAGGWTTEVRCVSGASPARTLRGPSRLLFGFTLDLNRADAKALEVLPQIGPSRAAAIVAAREQARFASVEDLVRVRGIGPKTVRGLAGWVSVGEAP